MRPPSVSQASWRSRQGRQRRLRRGQREAAELRTGIQGRNHQVAASAVRVGTVADFALRDRIDPAAGQRLEQRPIIRVIDHLRLVSP